MAFLDIAAGILMKGRPERGAARRRTAAAVSHALQFTTWQSLTRAQELSNAEAVAVMAAMVEAAGSSSTPSLGSRLRAGYVSGSLRVIPNRQGSHSARAFLHRPLSNGGSND